MKEPYIWDYSIKVKTKDGEYVYEIDALEHIEQVLSNHPGYIGVEAKRKDKEAKGKQLIKKITPKK